MTDSLTVELSSIVFSLADWAALVAWKQKQRTHKVQVRLKVEIKHSVESQHLMTAEFVQHLIGFPILTLHIPTLKSFHHWFSVSTDYQK